MRTKKAKQMLDLHLTENKDSF